MKAIGASKSQISELDKAIKDVKTVNKVAKNARRQIECKGKVDLRYSGV